MILASEPTLKTSELSNVEKLSDRELIGELFSSIFQFRTVVEIAWTKGTAYPVLKEQPDVGRFKARGQCAVTARLLIDVIHNEYPDLEVQNYVGQVFNQTGEVITNNHVWIEIPLEEDSLIIDVTPDQPEGLGDNIPPIVMGTKSELASMGYVYEKTTPDTDDEMQESDTNSFDRYKRLKKRYERVAEEIDYYQELINGNVFIIAPVAAGKTELLSGLQEVLPFAGIDVGKLFRIAAYLVLNDEEIDSRIVPNIELLADHDQEEIDRIVRLTYQKTKLFEKGLLERTTYSRGSSGKLNIMYSNVDLGNQLQSPQIDILVSAIAKSPKVREIIWRWINQYMAKTGGVILTGHSLKDIDTTKYQVIQLDVDNDVAAQRMMMRNADQYQTKEQALATLQHRNATDKVLEMQQLLANDKKTIKIDTTTLSIDQLKFRALAGLIRRAKKKAQRKVFQAESELQHAEFKWEVNPLLATIRAFIAEELKTLAVEYQSRGVTEFDIAVQTMIHIAGYSPSEIWIGDPTTLGDIESLIKLNQPLVAVQKFDEAISSGELSLNHDLVIKETQRQAERLAAIYATTSTLYQGEIIKLPAEYMGNVANNPFISESPDQSQINSNLKEIRVDEQTGERQLYVREQVSGKNIVLKRVPSEISAMYGKGFHYLHEGRADEVAAYGAYVEGDALPFAWVSYSQVERGYKQEMLDHLGIQPHLMLEMTRAWNCAWSPKNTMSILFAFAHSDMIKESQDQVAKGSRDKPLQGVVTAINSNLGFRANAFNGVGFETVAFKPANFTYYRNDQDELTYMPRRKIAKQLNASTMLELADNPHYQVNQIPLLPTNEMVVLFDKRQAEELKSRPIYMIDSNEYQNT